MAETISACARPAPVTPPSVPQVTFTPWTLSASTLALSVCGGGNDPATASRVFPHIDHFQTGTVPVLG